jgi:hypothetical protein
MDKLKQQLAPVIQHSFWIMCGGILAVCLVSWYMSTKQLSDLKQKQVTEIDGVISQVKAIQSKTNHPNDKTAEAMQQVLRIQALEVANSWAQQYDNQAQVLVWPQSFDQRFRDAVNKFRPIEIVPPPPSRLENELPNEELSLYRLFIDEELPTLADTIGAKWRAVAKRGSAGTGSGMAGSDASGYGGTGYSPTESNYGGDASGYGSTGGMTPYGSGGTAAAGPVDTTIVDWKADNQQQLMDTHFGFIDRPGVPSTLEVLYAQEDMWVLQNIMDIIRAANRVGNRDAEARHEAAIKRLDFVRIGRSAMGMAGKVMGVGGSAAGGPGSMMPGMDMASSASSAMPGSAESGGSTMPGSMMPGSMMPGSTMPGSGGVSAIPTDPAYGRYVDPTYQILDPAKLRAALTSKSPEDALLAVAKRMPVRMRFQVDQRRLNRVVAECGNARLPVEIRQIRVNRPAAASGGMGSYGGGGSGYGGDDAYGSSGSEGYGDGYGGGGMDAYGGSGGSTMPGTEAMGSGYDPYGGSGSAGYGSSMPGTGGFGKAAPKRVGGASSTAAVDQNLIEVELYGIVYIYNPVNRSQLGLDQADGSETSDPTANTTTSEATPPDVAAPETATPAAPVTPESPAAPSAPTTPVAPTTTPISAPAVVDPAAGNSMSSAPAATSTTSPPAAAVAPPSTAASTSG